MNSSAAATTAQPDTGRETIEKIVLEVLREQSLDEQLDLTLAGTADLDGLTVHSQRQQESSMVTMQASADAQTRKLIVGTLSAFRSGQA